MSTLLAVGPALQSPFLQGHAGQHQPSLSPGWLHNSNNNNNGSIGDMYTSSKNSAGGAAMPGGRTPVARLLQNSAGRIMSFEERYNPQPTNKKRKQNRTPYRCK